MSNEGEQTVKRSCDHNDKQIARYLEYAPSFIGPGAPPSEPMGKKHKGTSRPPATDKAMDFWMEPSNRVAGLILNPLIAEMRNSGLAWRGVYFSTVLTHLYEDPTSVPRWEREETKYDRERLAAFKKMCKLLAATVAAQYGPHRQINVVVSKRAEQKKREDWQAEHNRDNNEKRSEKARDLAEQIREHYEWLKGECPDWTDAEIRTKIQHDFGHHATKGNMALSRETVNKALREGDGAAA